jgi:predicted AAA+ superfamily ATPase
MKYVNRQLENELKRAARHFPAVILCGPRRAGKTTLLRHLYPDADYVLLEDPDWVARVRADPQGFLDERTLPVILDEIQNVPELFNFIRSRIDSRPSRRGQWFLTGSQEAPLMRQVTESMAGRAAVYQLLPFSAEESEKVSPLKGGFPEALARPSAADIWFRSYVQTYLERDIRSVSSIRDLATFRRFMALLATRCGQMLNKTDLAAPLGVSVPTITQWLSILEITGQIILVPPFYENFGKRLVKTPKLYFVDSGLLCHLLGIPDEKRLAESPFRGAVLEGFVASEVTKHRLNRGRERALYYFRDRQGLEVDFLVDRGNRRLLLLEVKATQTPMPRDGQAMMQLKRNIKRYKTAAFLIHPARGSKGKPSVLCEGIKAVGMGQFQSLL